MFELKNIKKVYNEKTILDNINISVSKGEIVAVIGKSGAGKTTVIRVATLLTRVNTGELIIDGEKYELGKLSEANVRKVRLKEGLVFQNFNLFKNKTVIENVTEGLIYARGIKKDEAVEKALNMLKLVNMEHKKNEYPISLSGGESQRVGIARSLVYNPSIVFLDEPTSALDVENVQEVINVLKLLKQMERTILLVTHELSLVKMIADRVYFLNNGRITEEGKTLDILEHPKSEELKHFLEMII